VSDNLAMFRPTLVTHTYRLVLAWFVLSISVAIASPIATPQSLPMLCTATGVTVVTSSANGVQDIPGTNAQNGNTMDCPLCWMPLAGWPPALQLFTPQLVTTINSKLSWAEPALHARYNVSARSPPSL
jgi:hypothetical protein